MSRSTSVWATDPRDELPIKMGTEGISAYPPTTVMDVFKKTVEKHRDGPALRFKDLSSGASASEAPWTTITWGEYYAESLRFGKSLLSLDFAAHQCINILGFNSAEWFIANMGVMAAGGIGAGIYISNLPEACKYIANHSRAVVVVVENQLQLDKYIKVAPTLETVKAIVMYRGEVPAGLDIGFPVYTWDQFMELGNTVSDTSIEERVAGLKPGLASSLIYTSGTTGPPKAVMLSHDNLTWTTAAFLQQMKTADHNTRMVSYLPLSHIAAQIIDIHGPMYLGSCTYFAQPDALRGSLVKTLREVQPTIFFGVPRVWEKMYEKMQEIGRSVTGIKKKISTWAKGKGLENARMHEFGGSGSAPWGFGIANALVFSKVKASLGLDKADSLYTAAAPISKTILEYFASLNIHILEVFGQSECTGPHTACQLEAWKIGSVGRPMKGTESKLVPETGELCLRGRHIFMGYMYSPEKTAETIDEDGWLHSGDVAKFDDDEDPMVPSPSGFMSITGRIKELIITAGGENIPPVLIENEFKKELPCISNCMVIGDKRKFLSIIISLTVEVDEAGVPTDKLTGEALCTCQAIGSTAKTVKEAKEDPKWTEHINKGMKACNARTTSNAQRVAKWGVIPTDFSVDGGELTPTLKLKRGPAAEKYSDIIEAFYG